MLGECHHRSTTIHHRLDNFLELLGIAGFVESAASENHSIYPVVLQDTQIVEFLRRSAVRIAHNREIARLVCHIFNATHNLCEIWIGIITHQYGDEIAALRSYTASQRVWRIAQLFGSLQ